MATAVIDALLQSTAPQRPLESGGNSAQGGSFKPALDEAIRAEAGGAAGAPSAPTEPQDDAIVADEESDAADWNEHEGETTTEVAEAAAPDQATNEKPAEGDGNEDDQDAVEISEVAAAEAAVQAIAVTVNVEAETAPVANEATIETVDDVDGSAPKKPAPSPKAPALKPSAEQEAPSNSPEEVSTQQAVEIVGAAADEGETDNDNAKRGKASVAAAVKSDEAAKTPSARSGAEGGKHSEEQNGSQDESLPADATASLIDESAAKEAGERRPATPATANAADVPTADAPTAVAPAPETAAAAASLDQAAASTAAATAPVEPSSTTRSAAPLAMLAAGRALQTTQDGGEHGGLQVDRGRFLGRVEGAIRTAQQRDGRVNVRLSPPELGALRIELTIQNGVMNARVEAETTSARNLLLDNLPALRDRLAQQDIRVDRFDVDVRRDGAGANPQNADDRAPGDPGGGARDERRRERTAQLNQPRPSGRSAAPRTGGNAALDVRV